jgi:dTDP-4-amino-4,6-dideoxygalactose transaminase
MPSRIPFNRPFLAGRELEYISEAARRGHLSADGLFTRRCAQLLEQRFGISTVLLTASGTAALELAAMLCDLGPGDEVLMPSYTFVSTASAVVRCGARPVFVDIHPETLNLDERLLDAAATQRTRAIFPVHYGGVACEMEPILQWAAARRLRVVEDAAQGVDATYQGRALGSLGDLGVYSFHETKNCSCGEGGALCVNRSELRARAEILRDKGTNRQQFFRGVVDKYTWVALGSSFGASEIACAFLLGQLEHLDAITRRRRELAAWYQAALAPLEAAERLRLPRVPDGRRANGHLFYILLRDEPQRDAVVQHLRQHAVQAVFHYVPLHTSPMGRQLGYAPGQLPVTEALSGRLLRLPMYFELTQADQQRVVDALEDFFRRRG